MPTSFPVIIARIVDGPLHRRVEDAAFLSEGWRAARDADGPLTPGVVGAGLRFEGIVRRAETSEAHAGEERDLRALVYQTYDPMAERELRAAVGGGLFFERLDLRAEDVLAALEHAGEGVDHRAIERFGDTTQIEERNVHGDLRLHV